MKRKLQDGRPPDLCSCGVFGQAIEVTLKSLKMCGEHESLNNPWENPWDFPCFKHHLETHEMIS